MAVSIIKRDRFAYDPKAKVSAYRVEGNLYVDVRNEGEHHSTIRKEAKSLIDSYNEVNCTSLVVNAYVGPVFYRDDMGYPVADKRFTVVDMA